MDILEYRDLLSFGQSEQVADPVPNCDSQNRLRKPKN